MKKSLKLDEKQKQNSIICYFIYLFIVCKKPLKLN